MDLQDFILDVKDFPQKGVTFKDITPLLQDGAAFAYAIKEFAKLAKDCKAELIVGPESRGFIFGCPVATSLSLGFVPARKAGKLPREAITETYDLEYGSDSLHIHVDAIKKGQNVVIIDDLLATGGTLKTLVSLIEKLGGIVTGIIVLIELSELQGREGFANYAIHSLIKY